MRSFTIILMAVVMGFLSGHANAMAAGHGDELVHCGSILSVTSMDGSGLEKLSLKSLLSALNAHQITATITPESPKVRYYELWLVTSAMGKESTQLFGFTPVKDGSATICLTSVANDSSTVTIGGAPTMSNSRKIEMPTANSILLSCEVDSMVVPNDTVFVTAYTQGIEKMYGDNHGYDYCGLRASNVHPSKWYETYGISHYIYLLAVPIRKIDFEKYK